MVMARLHLRMMVDAPILLLDARGAPCDVRGRDGFSRLSLCAQARFGWCSIATGVMPGDELTSEELT